MTKVTEVIKAAIPNATPQVCEFILWNRTAYPFVKLSAKELFQAAYRFRRAQEHGHRLCDFCDRLAPEGENLCFQCTTRLNKPEKKFGTYELPVSKCLACGELVNAATGTEDEGPPEPGAVTLCWHCGHIMVLDENLEHRDPTSEEMYQIAGNPKILALQRGRGFFK